MDAIPSLSVDGFTTNKAIMVIKLYEHFLCSDYSQSNTFFGKIASLKYLISEAKDGAELGNMCTDTLKTMYYKYFPSVAVDVVVTESGSKTEINLTILATDDNGETHKLSRLIELVDNNIVNFNELQEAFNV